MPHRIEVQPRTDSRGTHIAMVQHLYDPVQPFSASRQPRSDGAPEIMKPHIWNPRRQSYAVPGPFHILQMAGTILTMKHLRSSFHPRQAPKPGDERVGLGQDMRPTGLGVWDPPLGLGQTHLVPSHGQHFGASRAGQERGQQDRADK
jgi:hypothetical protein